jgi:hypothetical protein
LPSLAILSHFLSAIGDHITCFYLFIRLYNMFSVISDLLCTDAGIHICYSLYFKFACTCIFSNGVFRIRILTKITQPRKLCDVFPFETTKKRNTMFFLSHSSLNSFLLMIFPMDRHKIQIYTYLWVGSSRAIAGKVELFESRET